MIINKLFEWLTKKDETFAFALFACENYSFNSFNEDFLVYKQVIKNLWKIKPILYMADPFLFVKDKELFLFFELQHWDDPGYIAMVKTTDLHNWTSPIVVLRESFHLSFPFVFEDNGNIYMIPESQEADSIRLYKANEDLTSFTYVRTLIKKEKREDIHYNLNDNHVLFKDGKYYLFTSYQKDWMYYQELYMADDLLKGEFIRHPQSPICESNEFGRNGGSLIDYKGTLLRVTQDCHKDYGDNISLMEIIKLDDKYYEEKLYLRNVFPQNSIFVDGGHQLNIVQFQGKYIYATDYKVYKWVWYKLYVSIMKKLGLHNRKS